MTSKQNIINVNVALAAFENCLFVLNGWVNAIDSTKDCPLDPKEQARGMISLCSDLLDDCKKSIDQLADTAKRNQYNQNLDSFIDHYNRARNKLID